MMAWFLVLYPGGYLLVPGGYLLLIGSYSSVPGNHLLVFGGYRWQGHILFWPYWDSLKWEKFWNFRAGAKQSRHTPELHMSLIFLLVIGAKKMSGYIVSFQILPWALFEQPMHYKVGKVWELKVFVVFSTTGNSSGFSQEIRIPSDWWITTDWQRRKQNKEFHYFFNCFGNCFIACVPETLQNWNLWFCL